MQQITPTFIKPWQQREIAALSISQQWSHSTYIFPVQYLISAEEGVRARNTV